MSSIWKTVPSFPEYEASIDGEIRSKASGRLLKGTWTNRYNNMPMRRYKVRRYDGKWMSKTGASLVYEAFIGIPEGKIYHVNGITTDDRPDNLQDGGKGINAYVRRDKKPVMVFDRYGRFLKRYKSIREAAKNEHLGRNTIADICNGIKGPMAGNYRMYQYDEQETWR